MPQVERDVKLGSCDHFRLTLYFGTFFGFPTIDCTSGENTETTYKQPKVIRGKPEAPTDLHLSRDWESSCESREHHSCSGREGP